MSVTYEILVDKNKINEFLIKHENVNIVLWYVGPYGLSFDCVKYYKKIFDKLKDLSNINSIHLYDLSAWNSFFNKEKQVSEYYNNIDDVNKMTKGKFNGIKSSDFFKWLVSEKNKETIKLIKEIFNRSDLYEISENYKNSGITIKDIFGDIEIFGDIKNKDSAKCYSVFQYVEILFIILNFA